MENEVIQELGEQKCFLQATLLEKKLNLR